MRTVLHPRTLIFLGGLGLLCLALATTLLLYRGVTLGRGQELEVFGRVPNWTLTDQKGRQVSSEDLRGKVVVADFIYTHCGDTCPTLSLKMQLLQQQLRQEGLLGERVQLLSFSTDPARDTPAVLDRYSRQYGADPNAWRFLTGPKERLIPLIVQGFMLGVDTMPLEEPTPHTHTDGAKHYHEYDVMHSNSFVLVDQQGHIRAYYDGLSLDPRQVVRDIEQLLG